ncbi:hypothetical protein WA171_004825 [Blastocystis sp. BT1]
MNLDASKNRSATLNEKPQFNIQARIKQIAFGKNTLGYQRYSMLVPKDKRKPTDPKTPDAEESISKRRFEGKLKKWRRLLHDFDPKTKEEEEELQNYLKTLGETTLVIHSMSDDCEEEDMSLWDLLYFYL